VTDLDGTYIGDEGATAELNDNWQRQSAHSLPQVHTHIHTHTRTHTHTHTQPTPTRGRTHTRAHPHMGNDTHGCMRCMHSWVLGCWGIGCCVSGRVSCLPPRLSVGVNVHVHAV